MNSEVPQDMHQIPQAPASHDPHVMSSQIAEPMTTEVPHIAQTMPSEFPQPMPSEFQQAMHFQFPQAAPSQIAQPMDPQFPEALPAQPFQPTQDHFMSPFPDTDTTQPATAEPAIAQHAEAGNNVTPAMPPAPNNGAGHQMVADQAPASPDSDDEGRDISPLVARARTRLTEEQWVLLMRVICRLFVEDLRVNEDTGKHSSKLELMRAALRDERIRDSGVDYGIS